MSRTIGGPERADGERDGVPGSPARPSSEKGRPALRVGAGIFLSRISGLVRQSVFGYFFGISTAADAWNAALRIPNVIQNLLGEGTLSASFIPIYAGFLEEGREEAARRFAGAALGLLIAVAGAAALVGIAIAPLFVGLVFHDWDPEKQALTVELVRILFPMTAVLVVSAWALGILNTHRRFFVTYTAPVAWNAALIGAMVAFGLRGWAQADLIVALAWGGLVGGVLQLLVQLPALRPHLKGLRITFGRRVEGLAEAIRNFIPIMSARGVVNLSTYFDLFLAGLLAEGAVAALGYAQTLYLLPISLFGMSVAASELPELSRVQARGGGGVPATSDGAASPQAPLSLPDDTAARLRDRVRTALENVSFFLIPSAVAYLAAGDLLIAGLYERGDFGRPSTLLVWGILAAYALGLMATARSRVLSSTYFALRDTRTPARASYLRVGLALLFGAVFMVPLDRIAVEGLHYGAAGLAFGSTLAAWVEYGVLRRRLEARIGGHGPRTDRLVRMTVAALGAAAAVWGARIALPRMLPEGTLRGTGTFPLSEVGPLADPIAGTLGTALLFGVSYLGLAALLGLSVPGRPGALLARLTRRS